MKTPEQIAAGLTDIQREALLRAKEFIPGVLSLTDWMEDSWDIMEGLSDKIADPVCGDLTPLGQSVRAILKEQDDAK